MILTPMGPFVSRLALRISWRKTSSPSFLASAPRRLSKKPSPALAMTPAQPVFGHGRGEVRARHADAHPALDHRRANFQISYFQRRHSVFVHMDTS